VDEMEKLNQRHRKSGVLQQGHEIRAAEVPEAVFAGAKNGKQPGG